MRDQKITIALMMKWTALIALNLAILRSVSDRAAESPVFAFMIAAINVVVIQSVLLGRPLRTFHYTFLAIGTISSSAFTVLTAHWPTKGKAVATCSALLLAWAAGLGAATLARRRDGVTGWWVRPVARFLQGMVIGFAVFALGATLAAWAVPEAPSAFTARWYAHIIGAFACPIVGGVLVLRGYVPASPAAPTAANGDGVPGIGH
jgi:hypothetical protein